MGLYTTRNSCICSIGFLLTFLIYVIILNTPWGREQRETIHIGFLLIFKDMIQTFIVETTAQFKNLVTFS